jgi:hypothetical protein
MGGLAELLAENAPSISVRPEGGLIERIALGSVISVVSRPGAGVPT